MKQIKYRNYLLFIFHPCIQYANLRNLNQILDVILHLKDNATIKIKSANSWCGVWGMGTKYVLYTVQSMLPTQPVIWLATNVALLPVNYNLIANC